MHWWHQAHLVVKSPYGMHYWARLFRSVSRVMWHLMLWNYFLTQFKKYLTLNPHLFFLTNPLPHQSPRHRIYFLLCSLLVFLLFLNHFPLDLKVQQEKRTWICTLGLDSHKAADPRDLAFPFLGKVFWLFFYSHIFQHSTLISVLEGDKQTNKQDEKRNKLRYPNRRHIDFISIAPHLLLSFLTM